MRRSNAKPQSSNAHQPEIMDPPITKRLNKSRGHSSNCNRRLNCTLSISLTFFVLYYFLFSTKKTLQNPKFTIIIDAGSTGTRIHVFAYRKDRNSMLPSVDFATSSSLKVGPGLSFYVDDEEEAGDSLVKLIEFAKGRIEEELWGETEIRLMGTAGLRLVDENSREKILVSCRKILRGSGFLFEDKWANVISGTDEGIYAWVAANYALGTLGGDPHKTTGIFELGGASAQVTFVPNEPIPPEFSHVLTFGEIKYNLYTHSFLNFGQDAAHETLRELLSQKDIETFASAAHQVTYRDPCTPRGYLHDVGLQKPFADPIKMNTESRSVAQAAGNFSECRSAALMLLQKEKDKCVYSSCLLGSGYIPKLRGNFIATENFFYTSKFFELDSASILSDLISVGERFCDEDWLELERRYPTLEKEELLRYCFSSAYIVALLHDSLGIALDDRRIKFANHIGNIPLDWALGAFIVQKMSNESSDGVLSLTSSIVGEDSFAYLPLFIIFVIVIIVAWSLSRWKKPQSKTIFDLEKGRYITKRVAKRIYNIVLSFQNVTCSSLLGLNFARIKLDWHSQTLSLATQCYNFS